MITQSGVLDKIIGTIQPRYKKVSEILLVNSSEYDGTCREHFITTENKMFGSRSDLYENNSVYTTKVLAKVYDESSGTYVYAGDVIRVFANRKEGIRYWFGSDWSLYDKPYNILVNWVNTL